MKSLKCSFQVHKYLFLIFVGINHELLVFSHFRGVYYLCHMIKWINAVFSFLFSLPVHFYRYSISPLIKPSCRHVPTCSQYMLDALRIHGAFRGLLLGIGRILRCRPGGTHGYDPVPLFRFRRYRPLSAIFTRREKGNRLKR